MENRLLGLPKAKCVRPKKGTGKSSSFPPTTLRSVKFKSKFSRNILLPIMILDEENPSIMYGKSLYLAFNFAINLKLLEKNCLKNKSQKQNKTKLTVLTKAQGKTNISFFCPSEICL